ncbi:30S ribosomal protein S2 [Candidatus Woesearchaeota archaeon]|nr:30S ribosomal protein S2 [Candidatus Woesearchaeota archaeon]
MTEEDFQQNENLMLPTEEYLKAGIHIGTKFKTKHMANFIYKTRPDGLSVLNIESIDERLQLAAQLLSHYAPNDIVIVARRENGWKAVKKFAELTGSKVFAGRYPPGVMTNSQLRNFAEAKIMIVTDVWPDRNAVQDALKIGLPVMALCDTNNQVNNIDFVIPCNNKGKKSLGLAFFLLTKLYMEARKMKFDSTIEDFTSE